MDDKNFEQMMENMDTPQTGDIRHQEQLKITVLNARRSSRAGLFFIIIPCIFLLGVFFKYIAGFDLHVFDDLEEWMARLDKDNSTKWIAPLLLVGLPILCIVVNALAITHFYWNKKLKELVITVKYKLVNIILLVVSIVIVGIFLIYAVQENIGHLQKE